jgi:hypothetical protein
MGLLPEICVLASIQFPMSLVEVVNNFGELGRPHSCSDLDHSMLEVVAS